MLAQLKTDLRARSNPKKAAFFPRFFKAGPGEYAECDKFIGITVPDIRSVARDYRDLPLKDIERLLKDPIHEFRLAALLILVSQFERSDEKQRKQIVDFYLSHLEHVNNWDLVDSSAARIVGAWLLDKKDTKLLDRLARSKHLWTQRVAMVATYAFIKAKKFKEPIRIAEILLHHKHDLIHKAVGWMLRELGKMDRPTLEAFLKNHAATMPRTMLRYAIEKFDPQTRARYLAMKGK
jgi:3-methyladenine DNA glycosylase AlkD